MTGNDICLYRMTHIENIPHILKYGIVHNNSQNRNPQFVSIGDKSLITFRQTKQVSVYNDGVITLGDYIPFYFGVKMPMLYVIQHGGNYVEQARDPDSIIYIVVSLQKIIKLKYIFYFSDGHATDNITTIYQSNKVSQIPNIIDWSAVTAKQWSGNIIDRDIKRRKQAECLIKNDINPNAIVGFVCYSQVSKNRLIEMSIKPDKIKIYPKAYY